MDHKLLWEQGTKLFFSGAIYRKLFPLSCVEFCFIFLTSEQLLNCQLLTEKPELKAVL